ncbi:hypothetical protein LV779_21315 [Streptomyces thinghirensis]|nr:hypothetical protein [Streptomyces thinghirensis]
MPGAISTPVRARATLGARSPRAPHGTAAGRPGLLARIPDARARVRAGRVPAGRCSGSSAPPRGRSAGDRASWSVCGRTTAEAADPAASTSAVGEDGDTSGTSGPKPPGAAGLPTAADPDAAAQRRRGPVPRRPGRARRPARVPGWRGAPRRGPSSDLRGRRAAAQRRRPGAVSDSQADAGAVIPRYLRRRGHRAGRRRALRPDRAGRAGAAPAEQLALAATTGAPDADIVVKIHDGSDGQRWRTDPVPTAEGSCRSPVPAPRTVRRVELPGG